MKAAVVSHGFIRDFDSMGQIMKNADIIVCADGGGEYVLKCGLTPDVLIGDLDSIDKNILLDIQKTGCSIIKYPKEKDYTDTQLAVDYAVNMGADEIILLGGIGDRIDHSLANIFLLVKLIKKKIKCCIINENNTIYLIDSQIKLTGKKDDLVSLIPVGGDVHGIYTDGLMYRLSGDTITMGDALGISNVFTKDEVSISIGSGYLLVIRSRD